MNRKYIIPTQVELQDGVMKITKLYAFRIKSDAPPEALARQMNAIDEMEKKRLLCRIDEQIGVK